MVLPASETFARQAVDTTSPARTLPVLNNRNAAVTMDGFAFTGTDPTDFAEASTTCGSTLAARKMCKVEITFTPSETGDRSGVLNVNDSATGSPQTAHLSGTAVLQATVSPVSLKFAAQNVGTTSAPQNVTLTNNLSTALAINGITFAGADPGDFGETNTCSGSLSPPGTCFVSVTFTPTKAGTRTAKMHVNDGANTPRRRWPSPGMSNDAGRRGKPLGSRPSFLLRREPKVACADRCYL